MSGELLHVDDQGDSARVAVLLHGMMGSSQSWWRVAPLLVDRGYRVLAVDLPGHGLSPRDPDFSVGRAAGAVCRTVEGAAPQGVALAMGHSFGGVVLAAAAEQLRPGLAVHVDAPSAVAGGQDREETTAAYERDRRGRTMGALRSSRPHYGERDCAVEALAAQRFDPETAAALVAGPGGTWRPSPGSVVVRAEPSAFVDDDEAALLRARGVDVRGIPGAAHSVWYSHFDEFVAALPEVFGAAARTPQG